VSSPSSPDRPAARTDAPPPQPLDAAAARALATHADPGTLLDVRDDAAFANGHVAGSGHLPAALLAERRTELPPRERAITVLAADGGAARAAAATLAGMGYRDVRFLDAPLATLGDVAASRAPAARLWRPNEFLAAIVARIPRGPAADLAAGAGREATFLALAGFDVEAWDEAPEALAWAADLARRSGAAITTHVANLEARSFALPLERYALLTCFRFLHRPLFPTLVAGLRPGGHLVYETYRVGQERFGRPRRSQFLLRPGELERAFRGLGLEVLRFEEAGAPEGPLTQRLWARKPSSDPRPDA